MLADAADGRVRDCAGRLQYRKLPKCVDVRRQLITALGLGKVTDPKERTELEKKLDRLIVSIESKLNKWAEKNSTDEVPRILTDRATRDPYKRFEESKGPLNPNSYSHRRQSDTRRRLMLVRDSRA